MKRLFFVLAFIAAAPMSAAGQDQIYLCEGTYQNRPCRGGQQGGRIELPPIGARFGGGTDRSTESGRARFGAPTAPVERDETGGRQRPPSGYDRGQLRTEGVARAQSEQRLRELSREAAYLAADVARLLREQGVDRTGRAVDRTLTELQSVCQEPRIATSNSGQERCQTAQRNLMDAQQEVRDYY